MQIALVNPEYPSPSGKDHGGIATFTYQLANALARLAHTVHVLAREGTIPDTLDERISFHTFSHSSPRSPIAHFQRIIDSDTFWERGWSCGLKRKLNEIHRASGLDLVEVPEYNGLAYELSNVPYKVVIHFHTPTKLVDTLNQVSPGRKRKRRYAYERKALRNASRMKTTSEALKTVLDQYCGVPPRKVTVIRNLMTTDEFDKVRESKPNPDRIDILFSGRLEGRKGAEILINNINQILEIDERVNLTFAGETELGDSGTYRNAIERILAPRFRSRVWFLGPIQRKDLPFLVKNSTIFLIPSTFDNAPNVLFEAMAAQTPIVATDVGGINEIIQHGKNGLLFPPEEPHMVVECLKEAIHNPREARARATTAYADLKSLYSHERIGKQTAAFYEKTLKSTR